MQARAVGVLIGFFALLGAGLVSCGGTSPKPPEGDAPPTEEVASLEVRISLGEGVPTSVADAAQVTLSGPDGFVRTLESGETFEEIQAGDYTVTVRRVDVTPEGTLGRSYGDERGVFVVRVPARGRAAADVTYTLHPGSGKLWTTKEFGGAAVLAYVEEDLVESGEPAPDVKLERPFSYPSALAFDPAGRLWVASSGSANELVAYAPEQLTGAGSPEPAVVIGSSRVLTQPEGLAFDGAGNLCVSSRGTPALLKYTADQLVRSGNPEPAVVIESPALDALTSLAFDGSGNLWVEGGDGPEGSNSGTALMFAASDLAASGTVSPALTLYSSQGQAPGIGGGGSLFDPESFALDSQGNLWMNMSIDGVWQFDAEELSRGGDLTPRRTVYTNGGGVVNQTGGQIAFDATGNLWIADLTGETLLMYRAAQLSGAGNLEAAPDVQLSGTELTSPTGLTFYPPPLGYSGASFHPEQMP